MYRRTCVTRSSPDDECNAIVIQRVFVQCRCVCMPAVIRCPNISRGWGQPQSPTMHLHPVRPSVCLSAFIHAAFANRVISFRVSRSDGRWPVSIWSYAQSTCIYLVAIHRHRHTASKSQSGRRVGDASQNESTAPITSANISLYSIDGTSELCR